VLIEAVDEALAQHARYLVAPDNEPLRQIGVPFQVTSVLFQKDHLLLLSLHMQ